MKKHISICPFTFVLILCFASFLVIPVLYSATTQSLASIFKSGKVRFVQDLVITDEKLPEEVYFQNPRGIATHLNGNIFVSDFDAHNIKIFSPAGKLIKVVGQQGQGPGDFNSPSFIDIVGDRLIVYEVINRRFSILDENGRFIKTALITSENGRPEGMKALPDGRVILMTEMQVEIKNVLQQWFRLFLLSSDLEILKTIYSVKLEMRKLITEPVRMYVPQPFRPFIYWDVLVDGRIAIGFSDKYEIEIHDPDEGKLFTFSHDYLPIEVNDEDKKRHFSIFSMTVWKGNTKETKKGAPDYVKNNTSFPKYKPAFKNIISDDEGNIWIQSYNKNREVEEQFFDVFDKKGKFIQNVEIFRESSFPSPSFKVALIKNKAFWKIETGDEGFYKIVRYKIRNWDQINKGIKSFKNPPD